MGREPDSLSVFISYDAYGLYFSKFEKITVYVLFDGTTVDYKKDGVMIHKPCLDGFWGCRSSYAKIFATLYDEQFNKTDVFYGGCNGFENWFLGKACKREKFYLKNSRNEIAHQVSFRTDERWVFSQMGNGLWYRNRIEEDAWYK